MNQLKNIFTTPLKLVLPFVSGFRRTLPECREFMHNFGLWEAFT